jgi:hypothetical protein
MKLVDGRWLVRRWFPPEDLGYRMVQTPSAGEGRPFVRLTPPSPNDDIYPPVKPGIHQVEVSELDVISDLKRNAIPIPVELADTFTIRPRWDETGPPYRLWYGETLCLEYSKRAGPQFDILRAFQTAGWAESIDRPTSTEGRQLSDEQIRNGVANIRKGLKKKNAPIEIEGHVRLRWYPRQIPSS